mmetsp:Transcript_99356/g.121573  ORF Transcript_99356/g.121573 Transcript_99356/m.121573 type:complete len:326 (+) Transcript_99356:72-1049(+)
MSSTKEVKKEENEDFNVMKTKLGKAPSDINSLENEIEEIKVNDSNNNSNDCDEFELNDIKNAVKSFKNGKNVKIFWNKNINCDELLNIFDEFKADKTELIDAFKRRGRVAKMILDKHVAKVKKNAINSENKYLYHCEMVVPLKNNENYHPKFRVKLDLNYKKTVTNDPAFGAKISNELASVFNSSPQEILIIHTKPGSVWVTILCISLGVAAFGCLVYFVHKALSKGSNDKHDDDVDWSVGEHVTYKNNKNYLGKIQSIKDKKLTIKFSIKTPLLFGRKIGTFQENDERLSRVPITSQNRSLSSNTNYTCKIDGKNGFISFSHEP